MSASHADGALVSTFDEFPMQRGHGFRVRSLRFGTRRFGLINHAAILAVYVVGVGGTQSIADRKLSDFVLSLGFVTRRFFRSRI